MKNRSFRAISLFLLVFFVSSSLFLCRVSADSKAPNADSLEYCTAVCIYDKTHGKMIFADNAKQVLNTSTSAKVTMGLLACELLCDRMDETVRITDKMLQNVSGYSMGLEDGDEVMIEDLLYGAICGSYNDAAYVLAYVCAGSSHAFVSLMNERVRELGALSTAYTNPLGFPDNDAMVTTLSDTLKIALAASENELYMKICSEKSHVTKANDTFPEKTLHNRNLLISSRVSQKYYDPACFGMNAGVSSEESGWSVITLMRDEGVEYICIVLGGSESDEGDIYAYSAANELCRYASEKYNMHKVFKMGQVLGQATVTLTSLGDMTVDCIAMNDLEIYIPESDNAKVTYELSFLSDELSAPIRAGETIGTASVFFEGELVGECELCITEDIEGNMFMRVIHRIAEYTKSRAFIAAAVFFVISLPIVLIIAKRKETVYRKHKKRR